MPSISRIGDLGVGTCCCHPPIPCIGMSGIIITGASTVFAEDSNVSRITDIVLGFCGHTGILVSGSPNVFAEALNTVRIGSAFVGCFTGTIVTGATTVFVP